jgi:hypothetical protein
MMTYMLGLAQTTVPDGGGVRGVFSSQKRSEAVRRVVALPLPVLAAPNRGPLFSVSSVPSVLKTTANFNLDQTDVL